KGRYHSRRQLALAGIAIQRDSVFRPWPEERRKAPVCGRYYAALARQVLQSRGPLRRPWLAQEDQSHVVRANALRRAATRPKGTPRSRALRRHCLLMRTRRAYSRSAGGACHQVRFGAAKSRGINRDTDKCPELLRI